MFNHDRVTLFLVDEDENLDGQLCYMCFFYDDYVGHDSNDD